MGEELVVSSTDLDVRTSRIAQEIINEEDIDKIKDLTHLFNLNQAKKNVLRVMKLNGLLDTVSDRIIERFDKYPDNFSSADLLNYLQVTQNAIDKANKNLNLVEDTPVIQVNHNNQVNVSIIDSFDRDSKERVMNFIKSVLNNSAIENEPEYIEIKEEDDSNV
jgi:hypothetical protein